LPARIAELEWLPRVQRSQGEQGSHRLLYILALKLGAVLIA